MNPSLPILPNISLGIVLYTGHHYLEECFASLFSQEYAGETEILVRDHSPDASGISFLKSCFSSDQLRKIRFFSGENIFHSGGHNFLISQSTGEYYICASYDAVYDSCFVSELTKAMEEHQEYGSGTPKIFQMSNRNTLDSTGIMAKTGGRFSDRGYGETDTGQYDDKTVVWGASGAGAIYRRSALESVCQNGEYFDERLHYKNDVDLSCRLQQQDIHCCFIPRAHQYHDRQVAKNSQKQKQQKCDSTIGHLLVMEKNRSFQDSLFERIGTTLHICARKILLFFWSREMYTLWRKKRQDMHAQTLLRKQKTS